MSGNNFAAINSSKLALKVLAALLVVQALPNSLVTNRTTSTQLKNDEVAEIFQATAFNTAKPNSVQLKGFWLKTPQRGEKIADERFAITSPFGRRKSPGGIGSRFHQGVDVGAPSGTPLYAIGTKGEQVRVECFFNKAGGNTARIKAPSLMKQGIVVVYAHMKQPCKSGTYLAGEQIGQVGSTGHSTGPHLHFGMRVNGEFVPPYRGLVEAALTGKTLEINDSSPNIPSLPASSTADDFNRVIEIILKFEGDCSNHPHDRGGRTYKGITQAVAKANGFSGNVCTMPMDKILDIYRRKYWETSGASQYPWPLNLAIMNTAVNSGVGKAKQFLAQMPQEGTPQEKAEWFVNCQSQYYRNIIANDPSMAVFQKGWMRRSSQMHNAIEGKPVIW